MYGVIMAVALTSGTAAPDFGFHGYGYGYGYGYTYGCYGCYGGYPYFAPVSYYVPVVPVYPVYPVYTYYGWGGYGCCGGYAWNYGCCGCCGTTYYYPAMQGAGDKPTSKGKTLEKKKEKKKEKKGDNDENRGEASEAKAPASVVVLAPTSVEVSFNGVKVKRTSDRQTLKTPALTPGEPFHYVVTATATIDGKKVKESRTVVVHAGRLAEVDFRTMDVAVSAEE